MPVTRDQKNKCSITLMWTNIISIAVSMRQTKHYSRISDSIAGAHVCGWRLSVTTVRCDREYAFYPSPFSFLGQSLLGTSKLVCYIRGLLINGVYVLMKLYLFSDTPTGEIPILVVDGVKIAQSMAIARHLAREFSECICFFHVPAWNLVKY